MIKAFREGDVVKIPLPSGKMAIGWVVYVSSYFKNLVGLLACNCTEKDIDITSLGLLDETPIYTSMIAAQHYGWIVVGHKPISDSVRQTTTRIVGGEVFTADNYIRTATDEDRKVLHKMLAKGMPLVHEELERMNRL